jgi:putative transposase
MDANRSRSSHFCDELHPLFPGGSPVRNSRFSDEDIAAAVRQAEGGAPIAEIVSKLGISEATFFVWKKRWRELGTPRELRQLRDENAHLKRLVSNLSRHPEACRTCAEQGDKPDTTAESTSRPVYDMAVQ